MQPSINIIDSTWLSVTPIFNQSADMSNQNQIWDKSGSISLLEKLGISPIYVDEDDGLAMFTGKEEEDDEDDNGDDCLLYYI